jgi:hypothetical protein
MPSKSGFLYRLIFTIIYLNFGNCSGGAGKLPLIPPLPRIPILCNALFLIFNQCLGWEMKKENHSTLNEAFTLSN